MSYQAGPDQDDVNKLRELLTMMDETNFPDNDQRARYLLACNWMRDRDARLRMAPADVADQEFWEAIQKERLEDEERGRRS